MMKRCELYFDDRGDPESPGWVLRMTNEHGDDRDEWPLETVDEDAVAEAQAEATMIIGSAVEWAREDDPEVHAYVAEVRAFRDLIREMDRMLGDDTRVVSESDVFDQDGLDGTWAEVRDELLDLWGDDDSPCSFRLDAGYPVRMRDGAGNVIIEEVE